MRRTIGDDEAGLRLDHVLAAPLGSRTRAQRLIDAGRVTVDGQARPKRHLVAAGEVIEVDEEEPPAAAADADAAPDVPFAVAYEDDAPARDRQARRPRRASCRRPPQRNAVAGARRARDRRRARRHRPPPRPRHQRPAAGRQERAGAAGAAAGAARAAHRARVPRAGRGPPAGTHRDDRRADRARPPRPHPALDRHRRAARGGHPLRADRGAAGGVAAAGAPGHRAHPSDPRASGGHRPSRGGRPDVRPRRGLLASSASSCTPPAWPSTTHPTPGADASR